MAISSNTFGFAVVAAQFVGTIWDVLFLIAAFAMAIYLLKIAIEAPKRAEEKAALEMLEKEKREADSIALALGKPYGTSLTEFRSLAIKKFNDQLEHFTKAQSIIGKIVDTSSALSHCMVSNSTLYYSVFQDFNGVNPANSYIKFENPDDIKKVLNDEVNFGRNSIPLADIVMFKTEGEKQFVTEVSGGGGANLAGAALGGLLFGGAGAIVGSQLGTEIKSNTTEKEGRIITLYYYHNGKLLAENVMSDNVDKTIAALRLLIPEKEESVVQLQTNKTKAPLLTEKTTEQATDKAMPNTSLADELKKVKELLDMGVITQEEFDAAKKKVLGL